MLSTSLKPVPRRIFESLVQVSLQGHLLSKKTPGSHLASTNPDRLLRCVSMPEVIGNPTSQARKLDHAWYIRVHCPDICSVAHQSKDISDGIKTRYPIISESSVTSTQTNRSSGFKYECYSSLLHRVGYGDVETGKGSILGANDVQPARRTAAAVYYRVRWQRVPFVICMATNLTIKMLFSTLSNAVLPPIWTALCRHLRTDQFLLMSRLGLGKMQIFCTLRLVRNRLGHSGLKAMRLADPQPPFTCLVLSSHNGCSTSVT